MSSEQEKLSRERSPLYPAVTIEDCYEFIKVIDNLGGKLVPYSTILDTMGLTSPTTKSFQHRISASKQYGLIVSSGNAVQLTDIAKKILYPTDEVSPREQLLSCFDKPPLYSKLIERFRNKALPPFAQFSNLIMNEYRITKSAKDTAAECFIKSAEYLGILVNGVLCPDVEGEALPLNQTLTNQEEKHESATHEESIQKSLAIPSTKAFTFEIPTLSGKSVRVQIPEDVTEKDLDYIDLYIKNMLSVFIQNLKDELKKQ